jgi:hypothetical protein
MDIVCNDKKCHGTTPRLAIKGWPPQHLLVGGDLRTRRALTYGLETENLKTSGVPLDASRFQTPHSARALALLRTQRSLISYEPSAARKMRFIVDINLSHGDR